jgi:hypothetical protein
MNFNNNFSQKYIIILLYFDENFIHVDFKNENKNMIQYYIFIIYENWEIEKNIQINLIFCPELIQFLVFIKNYLNFFIYFIL